MNLACHGMFSIQNISPRKQLRRIAFAIQIQHGYSFWHTKAKKVFATLNARREVARKIRLADLWKR
jgi:hypothetical protein